MTKSKIVEMRVIQKDKFGLLVERPDGLSFYVNPGDRGYSQYKKAKKGEWFDYKIV